MPVEGTPAFNAVTIMEIDAIKFTTNGVDLVAKGAFVNTKNGSTYGSTSCRRWSKRTTELLDELRSSMEQDLANLVFERNAVAEGKPVLPEPGGIGEHLTNPGDAPSL